MINQGAADWRQQGCAAILSALDWSHRPERILACNVTAADNERLLNDYAAEAWQLPIYYLRASARLGELVNAYAEPQRLGADRWAAMLGARAYSQTALCVIDAGTAVTVDVIDAGGQHLGGAIFPGLLTMRQSLAQQTYQLNVPGAAPDLPADNTQSAIAGGTLHALAGGIERVVQQCLHGLSAMCLLTGGDAADLQPLLSMDTVWRPQLVFEGLLAADQLIG